MSPDEYSLMLKEHDFQIRFYDYLDSYMDKREHPAANLRELISRLLAEQHKMKDNSLKLAWVRRLACRLRCACSGCQLLCVPRPPC